MVQHLEEHGEGDSDYYPDDRKIQLYGNLFFILQSEPRHIATLCRLVSLAEIDTLLQTVMFTIYGNQYESREEHLLLTMFQVPGFSTLWIDEWNAHVQFFIRRTCWQRNLKLPPSLDLFFEQIHLFHG